MFRCLYIILRESLVMHANKIKTSIEWLFTKNQWIHITKTSLYVSDCVQFLKCLFFHNTQDIAMWFVALYAIDKTQNCLPCGLNPYL